MLNVDRFCLIEHRFKRLGFNNTSGIQPQVLLGLGKKLVFLSHQHFFQGGREPIQTNYVSQSLGIGI